MNYSEALTYLDSFVDYEKLSAYPYSSFKLERMKRLLDALDNPQNKFRSVHIAGTKGKGSTCAFIYYVLREAGFKTGLYTSPHLVDFRERIRTGDGLISEEESAELLDEIRPAAEKAASWEEPEKPTFFEIYTALAFLFFARKKIDIAVVETGLGGRLDATNMLEPGVSCITPVSFDHMDKLGDTLSSIANEKCGIIKESAPVISAPQEKDAENVIRRVCRERRARLYTVGEDLTVKDIKVSMQDTKFSVRGLIRDYPSLTTSLLGSHQAINAAAAIGVLEVLGLKDMDISAEDIMNGVRNTKWPGRLEVISKEPLIVLDGAQNRASARALREAMNEIFRGRKITLILGISKDKDIKGIIEELSSLAHRAILTKAHNPRAQDPGELKKELIGFRGDIVCAQDLRSAIDIARSGMREDGLILITGSLYLAGEAVSLSGAYDGLR